MTEKEYRSHPAISRSELWRLRESPERFKWYKEHPEEPTTALLFGQIAHKLLLQPESFDEEFAVLHPIDRRTKDGKAEYAAFMESSAGKTVCTMEQYQTALAMAQKVMSEPLARKLLDGQREVPFFWTDEMTGEPCKCRADCLTEVGEQFVIVDYKTTTDASYDSFMRDAVKHGYDFQAAMYSDGIEHNTGRKPLFVFVVQEKNPPYALNIVQADEEFVQHGYDVFRELIGTFSYCKKSNNWYGYLGPDNVIGELSLPAWMRSS